ncbi:hypothetical protein OHA21_13400 [Actinoplanes sp. NBC_00393]|uniref:hypothetical protein n=1 Tax=Actinoplanes sp. NBC_00393 TaxID=2975953 RepID=UPI002E2395B0
MSAALRATVTAGLLGASLAACTPATETAPATASSAGPPASAGPEPATTGIPGSALLQAADVNDAEPEALEQGDLAVYRPLRPCGTEPYPSDKTRTDAVAVRYVVDPTAAGTAPVVVVHFIGRHTPGGAAEQFDHIGAALKRCPGGLGEGERQWTVLESSDDRMLVRIDEMITYGGEKPAKVSYYAGLARVGDAVVTVTDLGWEDIGGSEKVARDLLGKAVQRAGTIS